MKFLYLTLYRAFFSAATIILAAVITTPIIGFLTDYWILDLINPFRAIWLVISVLGYTALGYVFLYIYDSIYDE